MELISCQKRMIKEFHKKQKSQWARTTGLGNRASEACNGSGGYV
jgi:hypothetical protein